MGLYDILIDELKSFDLGIFDKTEQDRRIATCQGCENYTGDVEHNCRICKCNINWKVLFTSNSCPIGKWHRSA